MSILFQQVVFPKRIVEGKILDITERHGNPGWGTPRRWTLASPVEQRAARHDTDQ